MTSHIPQSSFRGDIGEPPIIPEVQDAIRSLQRGATRLSTTGNVLARVPATSVGGGTPLVTLGLMPIRMDSRHDIHSTPTTTCKWTKAAFVRGTHRPHKGLWHSRPSGSVEHAIEALLPRKVHENTEASACWYVSATALNNSGSDSGLSQWKRGSNRDALPRKSSEFKAKSKLGTAIIVALHLQTTSSLHTSQNTSRAFGGR